MENYLQKLKDNGLKITPKRKAVIELFSRSHALLKPHDVHKSLRRKIRPLGLPTIYRILDELCRIGVITRFQTDDGGLSYAFRALQEDHTHQFLCRKCNRVEDIDCCNFQDMARLIEKRLGCAAEKHLLQIEGLCSRCR